MKILLYEPGMNGHRPVILSYTEKALDEAGISWVREVREFHYSPKGLVRQAVLAKCDVIYVLTVDGHPLFIWVLALIARVHGIRIVCTYYLYNNLTEGWRAMLWRFIIKTGPIARVHVSDERAKLGGFYPREVGYLPDPWNPAEFTVWAQADARRVLGLPSAGTIFLMFGMIDERKGADLLLRAFAAMGSQTWAQSLEATVLLAGTVSPGLRELMAKCLESEGTNLRLIVHDGHVAEDKVSAYYFAADYLVCAYPTYFKVASNTVTRALAAGRPIIVSDHGASATLVKDNGCGLLFRAGNLTSLQKALYEAVLIKSNNPLLYRTMCKNEEQIAATRNTQSYRECLRVSLAALKH